MEVLNRVEMALNNIRSLANVIEQTGDDLESMIDALDSIKRSMDGDVEDEKLSSALDSLRTKVSSAVLELNDLELNLTSHITKVENAMGGEYEANGEIVIKVLLPGYKNE